MDTKEFQQFFNNCVGKWEAERTYHYLTYQEVERSRTEFVVKPLNNEGKSKVLADNEYVYSSPLENLPGFNLGFYTISEKGEEVSQELNLLFVPKVEKMGVLEGDYLRDRAYEEARPIISHFTFEPITKELLMTTDYTRVVSVDSIILVNPQLRIRKIVNYQRSLEEQLLGKVNLVGFGLEQKVAA